MKGYKCGTHSVIDESTLPQEAIKINNDMNIIYVKLSNDIEANLKLVANDVKGNPVQIDKLIKDGDYVLILGAASKSGLLCCDKAKKRVGKKGRVIGLIRSEKQAQFLIQNKIVDIAIIGDAQNQNDVIKKVLNITKGREVDLCINCVNFINSKMSYILNELTDKEMQLFKKEIEERLL